MVLGLKLAAEEIIIKGKKASMPWRFMTEASTVKWSASTSPTAHWEIINIIFCVILSPKPEPKLIKNIQIEE